MTRTDVVSLCEIYDLKEWFDEALQREAPWIRLLRPDEVADTAAIRHAIAFAPGPEAFAAYPNLELVSSAGAGVDGILANPSLPAATAVSRVIVAEQAQMMAGFAIWHIVGWQRQMEGYAPLQAQTRWQPLNRQSPASFDVGVLGYGRLGAALAQALVALGFPVTALASRTRPAPPGVRIVAGAAGLAELAGRCRAVVNLLPLTADTAGILNRDFLASMRADAILINLGRGGHLVEDDLIEALDRGRPGFAALDVFGTEPLPPENPLWRHRKVRITPHVAADAESDAVARFIARGIERHERGEAPEGLVDRTAGY